MTRSACRSVPFSKAGHTRVLVALNTSVEKEVRHARLTVLGSTDKAASHCVVASESNDPVEDDIAASMFSLLRGGGYKCE